MKVSRKTALAVPMGVLLGVAGLAASGALSAPAGAAGALTTTTTALTTSLNPSTYGTSVTFTAHVTTATPPATGTVTFADNGTEISGCNSVPLVPASQKATCTTSTLLAGTDVISATYSGSTKFAKSKGTVTQAVKKATPTISWAAPAPITYPTALSGVQLDATASVSGTFTYSPVSGTVLLAGTHTLSVTFTPSTKTNYTSASATVALVVNPKAATILTHTIVTASPNPSLSGTTVTFTATVSPTTGGGTVTFTGAGCVNEALNSRHQAICTRSTLPVGTVVVTATYSGYSTYGASSGSVTERVTAKSPIVTTHLPTVTSVSPSSGGAHDSVTITGTNFDPRTTVVYFGGRQAPHIHFLSDTQVTCWSPVRAGTVDVTVKTPVGTSAVTGADQFTYVPPTVNSVVPHVGGNRTLVTITGTNFISGDTVRFSGKLAPHVQVINANEITADSPFGHAGATVNVTVSAPGLSGTSPVTYGDRFTYQA
jgi:hypothetical protein